MKSEKSPAGLWRAELLIQGDTLPFNFELEISDSGNTIYLLNADEKLRVDDVKIDGDSLIADMHIFDTRINAKITGTTMIGTFQKNYVDNYILEFKAQKGNNYRFLTNPQTDFDISGRWEVQFASLLEDSIKSIGEFSQNGSKVKGTFLTTTGDYRFLEGEMQGNTLMLSCFDGEHAFLFKAQLNENGELEGIFRSGKTWNETWSAMRNENIKLDDPYGLTYLKEGHDAFEFSLPDMNGDTLNFGLETFQDKVVLVQILGTWCPNCMDETKYLSDWYQKNEANAEIIGVAFEKKNDLDYARSRINLVKSKLGADYTFLFGGVSDKDHASSVFPMLNEISSFPTLIILDKKHRVRKIHTGFSGPGTGKHFEEFKYEFESFMDLLIAESHSGDTK